MKDRPGRWDEWKLYIDDDAGEEVGYDAWLLLIHELLARERETELVLLRSHNNGSRSNHILFY